MPNNGVEFGPKNIHHLTTGEILRFHTLPQITDTITEIGRRLRSTSKLLAALSLTALAVPFASEDDAYAAQSITASPNPIPAGTGMGTTEINWNTGSPTGEVTLSVNGAPEVLFNRGVSGVDKPNWFNAGYSYDFNVYFDASHASRLGSTRVLRSVVPEPLSMTPQSDNPNLYTLSFDGNGTSDTFQVWVAVDNGPQSLVVQNPHYIWTNIPWIEAGHTYHFTEYAGQGKLASAIVNSIDVVKSSVLPTPTPVNELPQSVTWASQTWSINPNLTFGETPNNTNRGVTTIDISGGSMSRIQPYESLFGVLSGNNRSLGVAAIVRSDTLNWVIGAITLSRGNNMYSADALAFNGANPTDQQVVGLGMDKTSLTFGNPIKSFTKTIGNGVENLRIIGADNSVTNCNLTISTVPCTR